MNEVLLGVAIAALSIGATYFFCIRPMRRHMQRPGRAASQGSCAAAVSTEPSEVDRLRGEIAALREGAHMGTMPQG